MPITLHITRVLTYCTDDILGQLLWSYECYIGGEFVCEKPHSVTNCLATSGSSLNGSHFRGNVCISVQHCTSKFSQKLMYPVHWAICKMFYWKWECCFVGESEKVYVCACSLNIFKSTFISPFNNELSFSISKKTVYFWHFNCVTAFTKPVLRFCPPNCFAWLKYIQRTSVFVHS